MTLNLLILVSLASFLTAAVCIGRLIAALNHKWRCFFCGSVGPSAFYRWAVTGSRKLHPCADVVARVKAREREEGQ